MDRISKEEIDGMTIAVKGLVMFLEKLTKIINDDEAPPHGKVRCADLIIALLKVCEACTELHKDTMHLIETQIGMEAKEYMASATGREISEEDIAKMKAAIESIMNPVRQ